MQPCDLAIEKEADCVVLPIAIVNISGNNDEAHRCVDRSVDQFRERLSTCGCEPLRDFFILNGQARQGTPEMKVGSVHKGKG